MGRKDKVKPIDGQPAVASTVVSSQVKFTRSGLLPEASEFAGYETVLPGAGERILSMAERQSLHRQELEKTVVRVASRDSILGLIFAFAFAMLALVSSVYLISTNHAVTGTILGGVSLAAVVSAFIQGRLAWKKDGFRYSGGEVDG